MPGYLSAAYASGPWLFPIKPHSTGSVSQLQLHILLPFILHATVLSIHRLLSSISHSAVPPFLIPWKLHGITGAILRKHTLKYKTSSRSFNLSLVKIRVLSIVHARKVSDILNQVEANFSVSSGSAFTSGLTYCFLYSLSVCPSCQ